MSHDLLIVGSGPVGSSFARVVWERLPEARILMVDAGPALTDPPGLNLKNLDDVDAVRRARELSHGPPDAPVGDAGIPTVEGTITARQGTHLVDPGGHGMPAAAVSTCVGGMGRTGPPVITVPFSDPHPYHAQVMHVERIPFPLPGLVEPDAPAGLATMGWGFRKWPRPDDGVAFSADRTERVRYAGHDDRV